MKTPPTPPGSRGAFHRLASLEVTFVALALLLSAVVLIQLADVPATYALLPAALLLFVNLAAALAVTPLFSRTPALLLFHLALLSTLPLAGIARMVYFQGGIELAVGETFEGDPIFAEQGPWHRFDLANRRLTHLGFRIHFAPGLIRTALESRLAYLDDRERMRETDILETTPPTVGGYQIKPGSHFGFAILFDWRLRQGRDKELGQIHLPSLRLSEHGSQQFTPPGGNTPVLAQLRADRPLLDRVRAFTFDANALPATRLRLTFAGKSVDLAPGEAAELPEGTLVYREPRAWLGFVIHHDPVRPWLLATILIAIFALSWHFLGRFRQQPWLRDPPPP